MIDLNVVSMSGRLTADSEVKATKSGKKVTSFNLAVNDDYKKNEEWISRAYFFNVMYSGEKQLMKGMQVMINGKLTMRKVEKDGITKTYVNIVADKIIPIKVPVVKEEKKDLFVDDTFEQDYEDLQNLREAQKQAKKKEELDEEVPF